MHKAKQMMLTYRNALLRKKNVVGCGIAWKERNGQQMSLPCVVAFVEKKQPLTKLSLSDVIPPKLGSVPTDVIEVGTLRLLGNTRTSRIRPAQPGSSIGHYKITAGTFGAVVYDKRTGEPLILSNNHVMANASDGLDRRSEIGDPIYQPGPHDGGGKDDIIGKLIRFTPITVLDRNKSTRVRVRSSMLNLIDAALARPLDPSMISPEILEIGTVTGTQAVHIGTVVTKSGRTTGLTSGTVRALAATLDVGLDAGRVARFTDQIVTSHMGQPGDSGSLGVTPDGKAFGLLFAGSDIATIFNRIDNILELLSVHMTPQG